MAITTRLPDALKIEADAYALTLGISLNALLAVSLREYLDSRRSRSVSDVRQFSSASDAAISTVVGVSAQAVEPSTGALKPPKSPRAPCPCGGGQQWRHCHGKV